MAQIGQFTRTKSGYVGHIRTLFLDAAVTLVPAESSDTENAPDYRIHLGEDANGPEIGAGWKRTGEKAGKYVSLQLDDPALDRPIRTNLFQSDADQGAWVLQWNRPSRRGDKD